ncbi:ABC transporter permease [Microbacterium sp. A82]|uniref:ABC transporter permease n=1 Tax=Microbacterium sp. A82 TaxID=3450452 RepID=UPI003F30B79E
MADVKTAPAKAAPVKTRRTNRLPVVVWVAIIWASMVVSAAILAPILPLPDPNSADYEHIAAGPMDGHLLGTDQLGRDILSRIVWGAQASLQIGFVAVALGMTVGMALGLLAGYFRGWVDALISIVVDIVLAFPALVFIIVLVAVYGPSAQILILGLGAIMVPTFTRLARANTLVWSQREFVMAATVLGSRRLRTLWREILPNVLPGVLSYAFLVVAVVMVAEGSLSFLGFGIQPPASSWGSMIAGGRQSLYNAPHIVAFPSIALLVTVMSFNFIGDYLRGRTPGRTEVTL